jgi:flagellar FliJ protein
MNADAQTPTLLALLQRDERERDQSALRHRHAQGVAQRAHDQARQLLTYRTEYEARWAAQCGTGATPQILHYYRSFMQRLDQAVAQQARQVGAAEAQLAQAGDALLEAERRVAAVRKLLERRAAEHRRSGQRRDQKHTDELAQRMRWAADTPAHTLHGDLANP